jgi:hypothetical protein
VDFAQLDIILGNKPGWRILVKVPEIFGLLIRVVIILLFAGSNNEQQDAGCDKEF